MSIVLPDELRVDIHHWSDALQRRIDLPAHALWYMAALAYEVDSSVPAEAVTPEIRAWLYKVEGLVAEVIGVETWDEAVRVLGLPDGSGRSLAAWLSLDDTIPPGLRRALEERG